MIVPLIFPIYLHGFCRAYLNEFFTNPKIITFFTNPFLSFTWILFSQLSKQTHIIYSFHMSSHVKMRSSCSSNFQTLIMLVNTLFVDTYNSVYTFFERTTQFRHCKLRFWSINCTVKKH